MREDNEPSYSLSAAANRLRRSVIRTILPLTTQPGVISFAGGLPAPELLPVKQIQAAIEKALREHGSDALQYRPQYRPLREWIADFMSKLGVECEPEQVFITNGCQQGLSIMARLLLDMGAGVIVEKVAFTGIGQMIAAPGAKPLTVETDLDTGLDVDRVEHLMSDRPRPRMVITVPNYHNPLGVSVSPEKRKRLAEIAARYRVPIVEDDPYVMLRYEGEQLPAVTALTEKGYAFYLGSFSKILAPAMRLGWIVAPPGLEDKIIVIRESFDLESSALIQRAVAEFCLSGQLEPHLERLREAYDERRVTMLDALEREFPDGARWSRPKGGMFIWVTLPEEADTWAMFDDAIKRQVGYVPGEAFAIGDRMKNTMRLNFSNASPADIKEGIKRLGKVVREHLEYRRAFLAAK